MKVRLLWLTTVAGFIVVLDQVTKYYIHHHFQAWVMTPVIPQYFDLTFVKNPGAAFGMLAEASPRIRSAFFSTVPIVAALVILNTLRTTPLSEKMQMFALSLVFGGAIGNYIDRVRFTYVVDFLYFHYKTVYYFPAFNVADSAICCGVGLLIYRLLVERRETTSVGVMT